MSAIPIHTESPISPAKATAITPQTAYNPNPTSTQTQASITAAPTSNNGYPAAYPGQIAPTPTQPVSLPTSQDPPAPRPGAIPTPSVAAPSGHTRGPGIPPPPKVGEKPQPPSYYALSQANPTPSPSVAHAYPQQMGIPSPGPTYGIPPASTTSTTQTPSFSTPASLLPDSQPAASTTRSRANTLEHPPGYVQNPQAQEMTPDARFATEQQASMTQSSEKSPVLPGYNDRAGGGNTGFGEDEGLWGRAKKLVSQAGEKAQEFEEEVWRKFGDGK